MKEVLLVVVAVLLLATLTATPAYANNSTSQEKCENTKEKIRRLQTRMRHGYTARQGIRMDDQMRRLKKKRSEYCR